MLLFLSCCRVNEGDQEATVDDGPHEMTLDEWKALQEQTRSKKEFNIRKPDSSVLSKAVVIHKSKYEGDVSVLNVKLFLWIIY